MNQTELKELRGKLLRVKHNTGCTLDECIDYVDKRIKPDLTIIRCSKCENFILREKGSKGGLRGVCKKSSKDIFHYNRCKGKRPDMQRKCRKYEEIKDDNDR